jgi:hypothetical protein
VQKRATIEVFVISCNKYLIHKLIEDIQVRLAVNAGLKPIASRVKIATIAR